MIGRRAQLLHTAALLTVGDRHLAEDLVQATLTKLYVAWPSFQRATNPDGYLRRVLVNALIDERRRIWRRREQPMAELPDRPASVPDNADVDEAVKQALRDLPPRMRALRRRRAGQAVAGSAFGVAALVAAFAVATAGTDAGPHGSVGTNPAVASAARLVAYQGAQPKGFTVDKVPDGWFVQGDDSYSLLLAPEKARNGGPNVDPSASPLYDPNSSAEKITIMLEGKSENGPPRSGTPVKVGDLDGTLLKSLRGMTPDGPMPTAANGDTGWELWVQQPSGAYMIVQYWQGLGLSQDQMVELGAGVHVHKDAQQSVG